MDQGARALRVQATGGVPGDRLFDLHRAQFAKQCARFGANVLVPGDQADGHPIAAGQRRIDAGLTDEDAVDLAVRAAVSAEPERET